MAAQSRVGPTPLKCSESDISGWRVPPTLPCSHGAWHSLVTAIPLLCAQQGALLLSPGESRVGCAQLFLAWCLRTQRTRPRVWSEDMLAEEAGVKGNQFFPF